MTTQNNYTTALSLLKERRKKLDIKPFDWAAWKKGTLMVLKSIFSEKSDYYKQMNDIDYEYSSWALRDTSGSSDQVKSSCSELLDICMIDINIKQQESDQSFINIGKEVLQKFLSPQVLEEIGQIISEKTSEYEKEEKLTTILKQLDQSLVAQMMASTLAKLLNK